MQFTKIFAILSLTAVSLAAPTVEMQTRTDGAISCGQNIGTYKCCTKEPEPITSNSGASTIGGLLPILPINLAGLVPVLDTNVQCNPITAVLQACNNVPVCCSTPANFGSLGPQGKDAFISFLNNNNVAFCPGTAI